MSIKEETFLNNEFSIVIPVFNEAQALGVLLSQLCQEPSLSNTEIIVVDDKSQDGSCEIVEQYPRIKLLRHRNNKGYSSAIKSGVKAATGKFVVWYDADGQHRKEDLIKIMSALKIKDLDYCIGARGENSHQDNDRKLGKLLLKLVVHVAAGQKVKDFNSGLRGFKREVLLRYLHLLPNRFGASTTTTLLMLERGYYGEEIPIVVLPRIGKSSVKQLRDGYRTLVIVLRLFLLFKPMRFFGTIGSVFMVFGFGYGLYKALYTGQGIPVLAALIIILGIQILFFGLISDQISNSRIERLE